MAQLVKAEVLGRWFGVSNTAVQQLARRGLLVKSGRGTFSVEESVRAYCTHLRELAVGRKPGDTPSAERGRLVAAQAALVEQRLAVRRGALLDAGAVEAEWTGVLRTVRAGVLRLPQRAGGRLGLTAEQVRELDNEARQILTELSNGEG